MKRLKEYQELLRCTRQIDYAIANHCPSSQQNSQFFWILSDCVRVLCEGTLTLPGLILLLPGLIIVLVYSKNYQSNALRKSTVKIQAKDVLATGKVVSASICFLLSLLIEPLLILLIFYHYGYSVTLLDYCCLLNLLPWFFYLTIFIAGMTMSWFLT